MSDFVVQIAHYTLRDCSIGMEELRVNSDGIYTLVVWFYAHPSHQEYTSTLDHMQ